MTGDAVPQTLLARTFVELADTLVDDFDVVDLLTLLADRCVEVLDVAAAGIMLVAPAGDLRVMASSSEAMRVLELFEVQAHEGPCLDCHRTGRPVHSPDLATLDGRWPRFGPEALAAGFRSVHALPLRLRGATIGALNLFRADTGEMPHADIHAAQAFADIATIAILHERAASEAQAVNEQLNHALTTRLVIEQAKGMIAEQLHVEMTDAFERLRGHARQHGLRLGDVARDVIEGTITSDALEDTAPTSSTPTKLCQWIGYSVPHREGFRALCACGWASELHATAGLAGAASDRHIARRQEERAQPVDRR